MSFQSALQSPSDSEEEMKDAFSAGVRFNRLGSMIRIMRWSDRIL